MTRPLCQGCKTSPCACRTTPRLLAVIACLALVACGASQRQTTLANTVNAFGVVKTAFIAYDGQHEANIVNGCDVKAPAAECTAKLAAYRAERAKFLTALVAGYQAVVDAYRLDTDPSVAAAAVAAVSIRKALQSLGANI